MSFAPVKQNRILVVEDDKSFLHLACRVLTREGYSVAQVDSSEACLDYLFDHEVELLILNAEFSGVSSLQILQQLKQLGINCNFLIFSDSDKAAVEHLKAGALDCVVKGEIFWERLILSVNKAFGFISVLRERDLLKERLHLTESSFYNLFDHLPQIFFEVDRSGKLLFLNKAGFELTGISGLDFRRGLSLEDLLHVDSRALFRRDFTSFFQSGGHSTAEYDLQMGNGSPVRMRLEFDVLSDKNSTGILRGLIIAIDHDELSTESRGQNQLELITENAMLWN